LRADLYQGDCLQVMDLLIKKGIKVDAIITDLPYGITACKWDSVIPLEPMWILLKQLIKDKGAIVLFGSQPFTSKVIVSNLKMFKYCWVWNKRLAGNGILAKKQPLKIHEDIMVFNSRIYYPEMRKGRARWKGGIKDKHGTFSNAESKKVWNDKYYPTSILEFSGAGMRYIRVHPTQKPILLLEYLIKTYTNEKELVLDFTMGSGTTGIACKNLNRNFVGIELDKNYFEIAKYRILDIANNDDSIICHLERTLYSKRRIKNENQIT